MPAGSFSRGDGFSGFLHGLPRGNGGIVCCRFNQSIPEFCYDGGNRVRRRPKDRPGRGEAL